MEPEQLPIRECREIGESVRIQVVRVGGYYDLIFPERAVRNLDPTCIRKYFYILKSHSEEDANNYLRKRIDKGLKIVEEF